MLLKLHFFKKDLIKLSLIKRSKIKNIYIYDYVSDSKPFKERKIELYLIKVFTQMIIFLKSFWPYFFQGKVLPCPYVKKNHIRLIPNLVTYLHCCPDTALLQKTYPNSAKLLTNSTPSKGANNSVAIELDH